MSFFRKIFGRSNSEDLGSRYSEPQQPTHSASTSRTIRPFDVVQQAEQFAAAGDFVAAERQFKLAIEDYRDQDSFGLDYAVGRYGAFLLSQDRLIDAEQILGEAIRRNTNLPAIWNDFLIVSYGRRVADTLVESAFRMQAVLEREPIEAASTVVRFAERAYRDGDVNFGESVCRLALLRLSEDPDPTSRWLIVGKLGHLLERSDRLDQAMDLWSDAYDEGSSDSLTATRLTLNLERSVRDYAKAVEVIDEFLERGLPASVEEQLRKRRDRCLSRITPSKKREDVNAFSVRRGADAMEFLFQARVSPPIQHVAFVRSKARCYGYSKGDGIFVDLELSTGEEIQRVSEIPKLTSMDFMPTGWGLGIERTAAVGAGVTHLYFFNPDAQLAGSFDLPDASSEISAGGDQWFVGCRNGVLYSFAPDGTLLWQWITPGSERQDFDNPYSRPSPYYVDASGSFAAIASMGDVYSIGLDGRTLWHTKLPNERETTYTFSYDDKVRSDLDEARRVLGVSGEATSADIRSAYRSLARATHPDVNPEMQDAHDAFVQVQSAYELLVAPRNQQSTLGGPTITFTFTPPDPFASYLSTVEAGVVVGSSQGHLYQLDSSGNLRQSRVLGKGNTTAVLRSDGTIAAATCDEMLFSLVGDRVVRMRELKSHRPEIRLFGEHLVVTHGFSAQLIDASGSLIWETEFSKRVNGMSVESDKLVCAAGVLVGFRRTV